MAGGAPAGGMAVCTYRAAASSGCRLRSVSVRGAHSTVRGSRRSAEDVRCRCVDCRVASEARSEKARRKRVTPPFLLLRK